MEKNFSVRYEQGKNLIEFFSVLKKRDWFWSKALLHRSGTIFFFLSPFDDFLSAQKIRII
ncbi:hypothetical protein P7D73_21965 [Enterococcus raffinosus]|uniref:hypothetical protein n=1 Tax=Enterococcus raffinosus TaxID=71452 RepID=UPI00288CB999|nr:hypothetical protein [Enterococcus raffinosus]MDT2593211.1 hypothetical protein [Enterococcus raffinosus]